MADEEQVQALLAEAKEQGCKLPRGKKGAAAAEAAIAAGNGAEALIAEFGLTAAAEKRKAKADAAGSAASPAKKKQKAAPKAAAASPDGGGAEAEAEEPVFEDVGFIPLTAGDKVRLKAVIAELFTEARKRRIKVPTDDANAVVACAQELVPKIVDGQINADEVLAALKARYGSEYAQKKTNKSKASEVVVPANTPIVEMFREMGGAYFKLQDARKGSTFQKAGTGIRDAPWEITLDDLPAASGKSAKKLPGVGKGVIDSIREFLETGTTVRLEELRAQL